MFAAWMLGFLALMAAIVWVAVVVGVPQPYVGLAVLVLLVVAAIVAFAAARRQRQKRR